MTPVERLLRERIRDRGPVSVADYMAIALGHPEHGYYRHRDPFGASGDFITAPEISQVFGELIGLWCAVAWDQMGSPTPVRLVELGPGRGTLMEDALRAAAVVHGFLDAVDLHLVETSPTLREAQGRRLARAQPTWHEAFATVPAGPTIVIANEFFDALPVEQFVRGEDGWHGRRVALDPASDELHFVAGNLSGGVNVAPPAFDAPKGAIAETCPAGVALAAEIGGRLVRDGGAALIVDYGHARSAAGDTLQAVARHRPCDVLHAPGEADLTAHVDFESLSLAAQDAGASVHGPIGQGDFLGRLGLSVRADRLAASDPSKQEAIRSGCRRLVAPDQMGTLFKALALTGPGHPVPAGFDEC